MKNIFCIIGLHFWDSIIKKVLDGPYLLRQLYIWECEKCHKIKALWFNYETPKAHKIDRQLWREYKNLSKKGLQELIAEFDEISQNNA